MRYPTLLRNLVAAGLLAGCAGERPAGPSQILEAKGGPPNGDTPVTTLVADADPAVAPALQVRSDGLGSYQNSSTLTSVIQGIGDWVLDARYPRGVTRQVYLEFSQAIAGSGPNGGNPVPLPSGLYPTRLISKCSRYGHTMQALAPGSSMLCPLHIGFEYGGSSYALQMNPLSGDPDGSYAETTPASIACVSPASGSGPCVGWRITPSGSGPAGESANVARLLKYVTSKGKTTAVSQGDFYVSFSIGVTDP